MFDPLPYDEADAALIKALERLEAAWEDANGEARSFLAEATSLIERAGSKVKKARQKQEKPSPHRKGT